MTFSDQGVKRFEQFLDIMKMKPVVGSSNIKSALVFVFPLTRKEASLIR